MAKRRRSAARGRTAAGWSPGRVASPGRRRNGAKKRVPIDAGRSHFAAAVQEFCPKVLFLRGNHFDEGESFSVDPRDERAVQAAYGPQVWRLTKTILQSLIRRAAKNDEKYTLVFVAMGHNMGGHEVVRHIEMMAERVLFHVTGKIMAFDTVNQDYTVSLVQRTSQDDDRYIDVRYEDEPERSFMPLYVCGYWYQEGTYSATTTMRR